MLCASTRQVGQVLRSRVIRPLCVSALLPRHTHTPAPSPPRSRCAHVSVTSIPENSGAKKSAGQDGKMDPGMVLDFSDVSLVFRHKSSRELLRSLMVLYACSIDTLVNHSYKLLTLGERLVGQRVLRWLVAPFYNQFVAGNSEEELGQATRILAKNGIRLMLAPMVETDIGEGHDVKELYAKNLKRTVSLIHKSRSQSVLEGARPICQVKFTAHLTADVLASVSTAYLALDFPECVAAVEGVARLMEEGAAAGGKWQPDPSSLHPLHLNPSDARELLNCLSRFYTLGSECVQKEVVLAVDAEYTYTNPGINLIALAMMRVFNTLPTPPIVWNTYQGYLKAGFENLTEDLHIVETLGAGVGFGAKIVRGAYLERERARAAELGYPDPVNDTYEDTGKVYNRMVDVMLRVIREAPGHSRQVIVASHNEASVSQAASTIEHLGLDPKTGDVVFGQVYGMADNISIPLAASGMLVFKSVPYGSVSEVLPYLSRRAAENRAVLKGARLERLLMRKELLARLKPGHRH